jgi:hypothetical protein
VDQQQLIGIFINWFPMLLLIGVWAYFCIGYPARQAKNTELMERQTKALEQIAAQLSRFTPPTQ